MNSLEANKDDLESFLVAVEDFEPAIPDELIQYYLMQAGVQSQDPKVRKLIALAAHKFLSDVVNDALQYCKIKQASNKSKKQPEKKMVLTMEDLQQSLKEYGVPIKKPEYFANKPGLQ